MSGTEAECLYIILPELYDPRRGYRLSTMWPGVGGTHPVDFYCGHNLDLAIEYTNELNLEHGHTPDFVTAVFEVASGLDQVNFFNA